jgi:putative ATP-dependent endonuclease of OLD family
VGSDGNGRITDRVIVVTDGDDGAGADVTPGEQRRTKLLELADSLGAPDGVGIYVSKVTLEADVLAAGNRDLIRRAFLAARPQSAARFDADVPAADPLDEQGRKFTQLVTATRLRKGDFAQDLASAIKAGAPFTPPKYLVHAIMDLVAN